MKLSGPLPDSTIVGSVRRRRIDDTKKDIRQVTLSPPGRKRGLDRIPHLSSFREFLLGVRSSLLVRRGRVECDSHLSAGPKEGKIEIF